ncbi:MAG: hypothetical protein ABI591_00170 [Kofleriaceae bacterium]
MRSGLIVCVVGSTAAASPHVGWQVPPGCPDSSVLLAAVAHRLDVPLDRVELAADVTIESTPEGFVAHVHGDADETRELASTSCSELTDAVAVIVARAATERVAIADPPEPPAAPEPSAVVTAPPVSRRSAWNLGARASGLLGIGNLPNLGVAGELAVIGIRGRLAIELAGSHWLSDSTNVGGAGASVNIGVDALTLRVGWRGEYVRAWLDGELGRAHATGVGLPDAMSGAERWTAIGGGAGYALPLAPHVLVVAAGEVEFATNGISITLSDGNTVYETPMIAVRGRLGLEVTWR